MRSGPAAIRPARSEPGPSMRRLAVFAALLCLTACADPRIAADLAQANAFLAGNAKQPGVVVLPSGLQYRVLTSGQAGGASPLATDNQRGEPAIFTVGQLIPAWTEALQKMHPGDTWMLYAPPSLAYGVKGVGPIPPNSALVFKIQLIGVLPRDASVGDG
jgi:FKBP-type peptidyl-prolyl cis-trans isomerase